MTWNSYKKYKTLIHSRHTELKYLIDKRLPMKNLNTFFYSIDKTVHFTQKFKVRIFTFLRVFKMLPHVNQIICIKHVKLL